MGVTAVALGAFALHADTEDWRKKGYWQYFDEEMQRFNQKMIVHAVGGSGADVFHVMLKRPVDPKSLQPLKGRKIRANAFYTPIVDPLGGSRVNLNGGEIYSALQKGVVEGAAWPVQGAVDFKWYEVAKYMMRPRFGVSPYTVTMNMDRFKKLSKADQALMLRLGHELEKEVPAQFDEGTNKELKILEGEGRQGDPSPSRRRGQDDGGLRQGRLEPRDHRQQEDLRACAEALRDGARQRRCAQDLEIDRRRQAPRRERRSAVRAADLFLFFPARGQRLSPDFSR